MADYSKTPLVKKLGIKDEFTMFLVNEPLDYFDLLGYLPEHADVLETPPTKKIDFIHWFVKSREELENGILTYTAMIHKKGMLWISWPKGKSKIQTDINGNDVRITGLATGLVDNKVCAVDDDWSAMRFIFRLEDR